MVITIYGVVDFTIIVTQAPTAGDSDKAKNDFREELKNGLELQKLGV